ncbi:MAG: NAD-dependent epimerase/dehydratase family protein [Chlorobi bacterium]|nr:NAD-dependent epimerase/dehydratase family protein [Chlorobiota bacterium]
MRYLITGGTGLIGQNLARLLTTRGNQVHILSRDPGKAKLFTHSGIRFFTGDIMKPDTLFPAMSGCDGIFHLAAYAKGWAKNNQIFFDFNVTGTKNVLEAATQSGIRRVVITSTAGVLGPARGHLKTEDEETGRPFYTVYEESKYQAEKAALEYAGKKIEVIITYPTRVFGPGPLHESNAVTRLIKLYAEGKWRFLPGNGKKTGNYVYVNDVAEGLILAMEKGRDGEGYILGGENLSFREMFRIIGEQTGKKRFMIPLPWPVMVCIVSLFLFLSLFSGRPPLINFSWLKRYMQKWEFSNAKAQKELGYRYRSFAEGVGLTWKFLQQQTKK